MLEPVVHLRRVVALLGRHPALAGIDLDVAAGEIVLLRGPNGAGKTTLLRTLAGLVPVVRGEAIVLGHDLGRDLGHERRRLRRRVGLLGHTAGLYDDLTVRDNVRFWTEAAGGHAGEAADALAVLDLLRLADVPVARLSAGQRRRTSIAVLVARRPELWLLDEPHAGLDAEGRDIVDDLIGQAVRAGATVVIASHELERADALGGRAVTMAGGQIVGSEVPAGVA